MINFMVNSEFQFLDAQNLSFLHPISYVPNTNSTNLRKIVFSQLSIEPKHIALHIGSLLCHLDSIHIFGVRQLINLCFQRFASVFTSLVLTYERCYITFVTCDLWKKKRRNPIRTCKCSDKNWLIDSIFDHSHNKKK